VIAGNGPELQHLQAITRHDDRIVFLTDVEDEEKPLLMNGCAVYTLPTKPEPDFVETFGIALTEKMLAGGGPVITTTTGGVGEAVGRTAILVEAGNVDHIAAAIDRAVLDMSAEERQHMADRAREYAMSFDRVRVFDSLFATSTPPIALTA
jgi:glycosyltransferase involved in cell wall biosynthesis